MKGCGFISFENLNNNQMKAVTHVNGPMLVLAGPGSGKTRVLTERIRYLIEDIHIKADSILVITFSRKAALEMQERFIRLTNNHTYPVNFGTFHAIFYSILKYHYNFSNENILTDKIKYKYIQDIGYKLKIEKATYGSWQKQMLGLISRYKNDKTGLQTDEFYIVMEESEKKQFMQIYDMYCRRCELEDKFDFDDMIVKCRNLLYKNKDVLKQWRHRYKYILIDEFQDINDIQYEVIRMLGGSAMNVFCVGDICT